MRISKILRCAAVILATTGSSLSFGNANGAGKVSVIGGKVAGGTSLYFGITPEPTNRAACSTDSGYHFVLDPSTPEGQALYSAILMAASTKTQIYVTGTGTCDLGQPMEGVQYWSVVP